MCVIIVNKLIVEFVYHGYHINIVEPTTTPGDDEGTGNYCC